MRETLTPSFLFLFSAVAAFFCGITNARIYGQSFIKLWPSFLCLYSYAFEQPFGRGAVYRTDSVNPLF